MATADNHGRGQAGNGSGASIPALRDMTTDQLLTLLTQAFREHAGRYPHGRPRPMPTGVAKVTSTDLAMVAFWILNGVPWVGIEANQDPNAGYHQAAAFVLADWEGQTDRLRHEFTNGPFARYDGILRGLKKDAASFRDRDRRRPRG